MGMSVTLRNSSSQLQPDWLCSGWSPVPNQIWSATWRIQISIKLWTFSAL